MIHSFGPHEVNSDTREVRRNGEIVATEPQVFDVLSYLIDHHDRVVRKEELLDAIWGDRFVSESALSSRIKDARRAIGDDGRRQEAIKTIHGHGFRFVHPDLRSSATLADPTVPPAPAPTSSGPVEMVSPRGLSLSIDQEFPFVGRDDVLEAASGLAEDAAQRTQLLLLGGEPGIGKSRLATEIAARCASDGFLALGGRCDRHLATSLQPWVEALTSYVAGESEERVLEDTVGLLEHLRPVMPAVDARFGAARAPLGRADDYAAIDALATLVERVSHRSPLVIVLDDVQWAGGATRALTSLLQRGASARLLMLLTFRSTFGELDDASGEWLSNLERDGARRVEVAALDPDDVDQLVEAALGGTAGEEARAEVWKRSEGHSLFAVELIRDLRSDAVGERGLPETVASLVRSRLAKLRPEVSQLVAAGAAIGPEFDLRVAAAAAGLDETDALDAVDEALLAQLVHDVDGRPDWFRFSHQLVPASALDAMSVSRRLRLHARLADELSRRSAPAAQVAHHLLEASALLDADEVIGRVRATAQALLVDHQYDRAAELLQRASELEVAPRVRAELLSEYGDACNRAGLQPRALRPFEETASLARAHGWDDLFAKAALGLWGQSPFRASQDRTVVPLLDEAIERSRDLDDEVRARLLAKRAAFNLFSGSMSERERLSARAVELVGDEHSPSRLEVLEARWMAIASPNRMRDCVELDVELNALRKELSALTTDACAPEITIYWRGMGEALRELADGLRADPRQRRDVDQWRTTALAGSFALYEGDLELARELTDKALPLGREPWAEAGEVVHGLVHLLIDRLCGDLTPSVERWRVISSQVPSDSMRATHAMVEAIAGDLATARHLVDRIRPRMALLADNFMGGFGLVGLTRAAIELEDEDLQSEIEPILRPLADQMLGHPWAPSLSGAHLLCRLAAARGDVEVAERYRTEARSIYERLAAPSLIELLDG